MTHNIQVTEATANQVIDLLSDEDNEKLKLRIYVSGGGCSGFQYGFTFDDTINEDDTILDQHGMQILVDSMSIGYLTDSVIDYETELAGSRFVIKNPNAVSKCGCGSSFAV